MKPTDGQCFGFVVIATCVTLLIAYNAVKNSCKAVGVETGGCIDKLTTWAVWACIAIGIVWIIGIFRVGMLGH